MVKLYDCLIAGGMKEQAIGEIGEWVSYDDYAALQAENERLKADSDRLDWMDSNNFTAYRQCDTIDGLSVHCVVVPEAVDPRRGCVNDGIREAIDAARAVLP